MRFYQACYGKPDNVNWTLFNVSPDLPQHMRTFFEKVGNRNAPQNLSAQELRGQDGTPLCLYEICSQDRVVGVSRVQYGSVDNLGRPTMCAQGFLFSAEDGVLDDPNQVLTIADRNFTFEDGGVSASLEREPGFTVESAMQAAGLDDRSLLNLMACIYTSLVSRTDYPLYLVVSEKEKKMKALIYCIYMALPYSLRYSLSFSDSNNLRRAPLKSVIISENIPAGDSYFCPETGKTNVDLHDISQNPERYPFLYYLRSTGLSGFARYCDSLRAALERLQMVNPQEYESLRLADFIMRGPEFLQKMDTQKLTRFLFELASSAPMQNAQADAYLAQVLEEYAGRGQVPNEVLLRKLQVRAQKTSCQPFVEEYRRLQAAALMGAGQEQVTQFLAEQNQEDREQFAVWCGYLSGLPNGHTMIGGYYAFCMKQSISMEELLQRVENARSYLDVPSVAEAVSQRILDLTRQALAREPVEEGQYAGALEACANAFYTSFPQKGQSEINEAIEMLLTEYWRQFRLASFRFEPVRMDNYRNVALDGEAMCDKVTWLMELYDFAVQGANGLQEAVYEIEKRIKDMTAHLTEQELRSLVGEIQRMLLSVLKGRTNRDLIFWYNVACMSCKFGNMSSGFYQMACWHLPVLEDDACFEAELGRDNVRKSLSQLIQLLIGRTGNGGALGALEPSSEEYKLLKRRCQRLQGLQQEMAKEEKARAKQEEKLRRQQQKAQARMQEPEESQEYQDIYSDSHMEPRHMAPQEDNGPLGGLKKLGDLFRGRKNR